MKGAAHSTSSACDTDSNVLCRACGLCCRGVWFSHVKLDKGEVESARHIGLPIEVADGSARFQQPCVLHDANGCTAYQTWRPRRCVEYRCSVLNSFDAGELVFDEALRQVTDARVMADRIQTETGSMVGGLLGTAFMERLERPAGDGPINFPPLSPSAKLDAVVLRVYFDKYFSVPKPPEREDA